MTDIIISIDSIFFHRVYRRFLSIHTSSFIMKDKKGGNIHEHSNEY